jgi:hypothetical protein
LKRVFKEIGEYWVNTKSLSIPIPLGDEKYKRDKQGLS